MIDLTPDELGALADLTDDELERTTMTDQCKCGHDVIEHEGGTRANAGWCLVCKCRNFNPTKTSTELADETP